MTYSTHKYPGLFVMIDGPDGTGKGTLLEGMKKWAVYKGIKVLDLREYAKKNNSLPDIDTLIKYSVIVSSEPTYSSVGKAIRDIFISNESEYNPIEIAHAFALDRHMLYNQVIIPALDRGIHVFQERGVITSLVYQPLQSEDITVGEIASLPGNKIALRTIPDIMIIAMTTPEEASVRLFNRCDKRDDSMFENIEFQRKVNQAYKEDWVREFFSKRGARFIYIDTSSPLTTQDTEKKAKELIARVFKEYEL